MDRSKTLQRIVGPLPLHGNPRGLEWWFVSRRRTKNGLETQQARRITVRYDPKTRQFTATSTRYISKRDKRHEVKVSRQLTDYLRSRLSAKAIARCTVASLTR